MTPDDPVDLFDPETWDEAWVPVSVKPYEVGDTLTVTGGPFAGTYTITQAQPLDKP